MNVCTVTLKISQKILRNKYTYAFMHACSFGKYTVMTNLKNINVALCKINRIAPLLVHVCRQKVSALVQDILRYMH